MINAQHIGYIRLAEIRETKWNATSNGITAHRTDHIFLKIFNITYDLSGLCEFSNRSNRGLGVTAPGAEFPPIIRRGEVEHQLTCSHNVSSRSLPSETPRIHHLRPHRLLLLNSNRNRQPLHHIEGPCPRSSPNACESCALWSRCRTSCVPITDSSPRLLPSPCFPKPYHDCVFALEWPSARATDSTPIPLAFRSALILCLWL